MARDRTDAGQASILDRHLGHPQLDEAAAAQVRAVLIGTGALAACEQLIRDSVREALAALTEAPFTDEAKAALAALAATATDRMS
jgi:geranylgeranyl diphosphate synthase type I